MAANQSTQLRSFETAHDVDLAAASKVLGAAAHTFVKHVDDTVEIWASSRDWFQEEWGRDTFIALPGLLLTTKRYEEARQVFTHFASYERGGLIPNVIREEILYNTVDASLWFVHALKKYVEATNDWPFALGLRPVVRRIVAGYQQGTSYERNGVSYHIGADPSDGLIVSPPQATWMDADPSGRGERIITPRNGKCVEINALWYGTLKFAVRLEQQDGSDASTIEQLAARIKTSYNAFWNEQAGYLYDVLDGDPKGAALRPNQIIAISHGEDLLSPEKQQRVLEAVSEALLTPGGLRTLAANDPDYIGHYDTHAPMAVKDLAYHQGTVWPWLMGPYCDAYKIVHGESRDELARLVRPLAQFCLDSEFRSLPEVFSGDPPFEPGGTTAQAWSVAEILRIVDELNEHGRLA